MKYTDRKCMNTLKLTNLLNDIALYVIHSLQDKTGIKYTKYTHLST